jgi:hypothetical protein
MDLLATRMAVAPTQQSQETLPSVWILPSVNPRTAATATKIAVHAPCVETAFRPMEMPSIPAPATNIQTVCVSPWIAHMPAYPLTEDKDDPEELAADATEEQLADIVNAINRSMIQLENSDDVV